MFLFLVWCKVTQLPSISFLPFPFCNCSRFWFFFSLVQWAESACSGCFVPAGASCRSLRHSASEAQRCGWHSGSVVPAQQITTTLGHVARPRRVIRTTFQVPLHFSYRSYTCEELQKVYFPSKHCRVKPWSAFQKAVIVSFVSKLDQK